MSFVALRPTPQRKGDSTDRMTYCPKTGKVCYETRYEANQARGRIQERLKRTKSKAKRKAWERDPYLCTWCDTWHLTSAAHI